MEQKQSFEPNELVAVRYRTSGTFGGMEIDWKVGIYAGALDGYGEGKHYVKFLPTSASFDFRSFIVEDEDVKPVDYIWKTLKGYKLMKS